MRLMGVTLSGEPLPPALVWPWKGSLAALLFFSNSQKTCGKMYVGVSENRATPKSSIFIGFSILNHPFWGTPIFANAHNMTKTGWPLLGNQVNASPS